MKIFLVVLKISEPPSFPINTKVFVRELWQVHNDEDDIFEEVCDDNKDISEEVFNDWEEFVEEVSDDIFIMRETYLKKFPIHEGAYHRPQTFFVWL